MQPNYNLNYTRFSAVLSAYMRCALPKQISRRKIQAYAQKLKYTRPSSCFLKFTTDLVSEG